MSTYRMTLTVEVDDDLLAAHDGDAAPPPNDVEDWYGGDLERALASGIAEIDLIEIEPADREEEA